MTCGNTDISLHHWLTSLFVTIAINGYLVGFDASTGKGSYETVALGWPFPFYGQAPPTITPHGIITVTITYSSLWLFVMEYECLVWHGQGLIMPCISILMVL
jgi:hypothetical protein